MAIKDNICTEGIETTCSSKILRGFVPPYSAEAALNLKKAGAILLGKTNMDEFAMGSTTETSWFGPTKNPWNTEHVRADLPVARVRLSQRERPFLLLVQIRAVPSASQVPSAA